MINGKLFGSLIFATFALAACGGSTPEPSYPVPPIPGVVTCYSGDTVIGGKGGNNTYLRFGWDSANATMAVDTVTVLSNGPTRTTTVAVGGEGGALTINGAYEGGTFKGTGTVTQAGEGAWAVWNYYSEFDVGGKYQTLVTLSPSAYSAKTDINGTMFATKATAISAERCEKTFGRFEPL